MSAARIGLRTAWRRTAALVAALALLVPAVAVAQGAEPPVLRGAGSTFAAPYYVAVGEELGARHRFAMEYQAVGSGEGMRRLLERGVDFGATERPLPRRELEERGLVQLPTAVGGVVITANLPRVDVARLRMDAATLVAIYQGRLTRWNDGRLAALNPGLALPALPIVPVTREDSSGTTFLFTSYLARSGGGWSAPPASTLAAPGGVPVRGNAGVARAVADRAGAIGYVEFSYASGIGLPVMQLRNRFGGFVAASKDSLGAAVRAADWELLYIDSKPTFELDVVDAACPTCWPIVGLTYVVAPLRWADASRGAAFVRFMESLYAEAESIKRQQSLVQLPSRARNLARVTLRTQLRGLVPATAPAPALR